MLDDKYVTMEIEKVKHIALVAHDGKKREHWRSMGGSPYSG